MRLAGRWFGWPPSEVLALPYQVFVDMLLDEAEFRNKKVR